VLQPLAGFGASADRKHPSTVATCGVKIEQVACARGGEYNTMGSELLNIFGHELVMCGVKSRAGIVFISIELSL
jgi:hypothetical protein